MNDTSLFIVDELATMIATGKDPSSPLFRKGTMVDWDYTGAVPTITVALHGSADELTGVRLASSCAPVFGGDIWVFRIGNSMMAWSNPGQRWHVVGAGGEPAFQNSWVNYGGGWAPAAFKMTVDGTVMMRGLVQNGTHGATIFTLPTGYWPGGGNILIPTIQNNALGRLNVGSNGAVFDEAAIGNNGFTSLNVSFSVYP